MNEIIFNNKNYISIFVFCERTNRKYHTVYRAIEKPHQKGRELDYIKIGDRIFIAETELDEYEWPTVGRKAK